MSSQIEDRKRELQIVRAWLTQNIAIVDAALVALETQNQLAAFNPFQPWLDMMMPKK